MAWLHWQVFTGQPRLPWGAEACLSGWQAWAGAEDSAYTWRTARLACACAGAECACPCVRAHVQFNPLASLLLAPSSLAAVSASATAAA